MPVTYQPWLVLLSIVMAIQGAYVGLSLSIQIGDAAGMRRRMLLAGAAFSLAVAIWTMHFVGMLAARLPFPVDYLVFPTLLSFLVCVIVVGAAVYAISSGPLTSLRLTLSAGLMGVGIFIHALSRHERAARERPYDPRAARTWSPAWRSRSRRRVSRSGSRRGRGGRPPLILSAIAFGIAVSGMHYTAMEGRYAASARERRLDRARALDRPAGDRGRDRGVRRVGDLSSVPGAGPRATD